MQDKQEKQPEAYWIDLRDKSYYVSFKTNKVLQSIELEACSDVIIGSPENEIWCANEYGSYAGRAAAKRCIEKNTRLDC